MEQSIARYFMDILANDCGVLLILPGDEGTSRSEQDVALGRRHQAGEEAPW
jgi:hypothetical protein